MARIRTGSLLGDLTGTLGGLVFQGGPMGRMVRVYYRNTPTQTQLLTNAQKRFRAAVAAWQGMTTAQRAYWNTYAASIRTSPTPPLIAIQGGRQAFIAWYTLCLSAGAGPTTLTPTASPFVAVSYAAYSAPDIDNPYYAFCTINGATPFPNIAVWGKILHNYPAIPKRGRWIPLHIAPDGPPIYHTAAWLEDQQLWTNEYSLPLTRPRKLRAPSQYYQMALKVAGVSTEWQVGYAKIGEGIIYPGTW